MASMVDVGLIEVNSRILKRIEDNDEAAKRAFDYKRGNLCAVRLYIPNWDALCARHTNMGGPGAYDPHDVRGHLRPAKTPTRAI